MTAALSLWRGNTLAKTRREFARDVLTEVAGRHDVPIEDILGSRRTRPIAYARFEVMWILNVEMLWSTTRIGRFLGGKDHTTVINGVRRWPEVSAKRAAQMAEAA